MTCLEFVTLTARLGRACGVLDRIGRSGPMGVEGIILTDVEACTIYLYHSSGLLDMCNVGQLLKPKVGFQFSLSSPPDGELRGLTPDRIRELLLPAALITLNPKP